MTGPVLARHKSEEELELETDERRLLVQTRPEYIYLKPVLAPKVSRGSVDGDYFRLAARPRDPREHFKDSNAKGRRLCSWNRTRNKFMGQ